MNERLRELLEWLNSDFEYECDVDSDSFSSGETGRGGKMRISASVTGLGIVVRIQAARLWVRWGEKRIAVEPPVAWEAEGGVGIDDGTLTFQYTTFSGGQYVSGWSTDVFQLRDDGYEFTNGAFEHERSADGRLIRGTVELRRMAGPDDYQWAPDDARRQLEAATA